MRKSATSNGYIGIEWINYNNPIPPISVAPPFYGPLVPGKTCDFIHSTMLLRECKTLILMGKGLIIIS
jgi:hypothetical protein